MNATIETELVLPQEIKMGLEAISLPEVQEIMKRLAKYNLGICLPHMHNEQTGAFENLPADMVQVESGLEVNFQESSTLEGLDGLPVAWRWQQNGSITSAVCVGYCESWKHNGQTFHNKKHSRET
jgi:hypothetical protein